MKEHNFYFVGDIMFDWQIRKNIEKYGTSHPFQAIPAGLFKNGILIGNLETTISDNNLKPLKYKNDKIISPVYALDSLKKLEMQMVSIANNHIYDYGREGLVDTIKNLEEQKITYVGAGKNKDDANSIKEIEINGWKTGLLARTFTCEAANSKFRNDEPQAAELNRNQLITNISNIKNKYDLLIILLHFGFEYCEYPMFEDVVFCRKLVDAGADIIVGHHPHVIQGIEKYKNGIIAYSLGNFLFDTTDTDDRRVNESFILNIKIKINKGKNDINYFIFPATIYDNGQVLLTEGTRKEIFLDKVKKLSTKLNDRNYKEFSQKENTKIIYKIRREEIIKYLKKGNIIYLGKKIKNIKPIHLKLFINNIINPFKKIKIK
jgi:poly-gamma-glutamate capsule biosynthesis protein CapA/YwtB (metallophosphatase superfamily)